MRAHVPMNQTDGESKDYQKLRLTDRIKTKMNREKLERGRLNHWRKSSGKATTLNHKVGNLKEKREDRFEPRVIGEALCGLKAQVESHPTVSILPQRSRSSATASNAS